VNSVLTIFKKELIDTLRDRRTIIAMIVVPLFVFPAIIGVTVKIQASAAKKETEKRLRVTVIGRDDLSEFKEILAARDDLNVIDGVVEDSVRSLVTNDSLDGAYVFSRNFIRQIQNHRDGRVKMYFKSDDQNIRKRRLKEFLDEYETKILESRFAELNIDKAVTKAVNLAEVDITTQKERIGKAIGGFLPYIFVLFCFMGSMYPAIDLGAGEKERGTLETLLTSPVHRFEILVGKFGVVVLTGIGSAVVSILGLFIGIRAVADIPPQLMEVISGVLEFKSLSLLVSLLLPMTIFFAGILLSLSMFARSFKEAQSIITPINILIIFPVVIGLLPGVNLSPTTALVPVLNVSLATREIVAGTIQPGLLLEVYASLIILAGLSMFAASRSILKEGVIFRG
jgi:sodium transport system permease protein